jgi:hypothetical protein
MDNIQDGSYYPRGKLYPGHRTYLGRDPGERNNRIDEPAYAEVRADLHRRLMAWMEAEGDYLLCTEHLLPVGAYVDGRTFEDQHDPGWSDRDRTWFGLGQGPVSSDLIKDQLLKHPAKDKYPGAR